MEEKVWMKNKILIQLTWATIESKLGLPAKGMLFLFAEKKSIFFT